MALMITVARKDEGAVPSSSTNIYGGVAEKFTHLPAK